MRKSIDEKSVDLERRQVHHFIGVENIDRLNGDGYLTEAEKDERRKWSDFDFCTQAIYRNPKNIEQVNFRAFGKNQLNELVADAMALGYSKAIDRLIESGVRVNIEQIKQIVDLIDEKASFNISHGGIGQKEYKSIFKRNVKAIGKLIKYMNEEEPELAGAQPS